MGRMRLLFYSERAFLPRLGYAHTIATSVQNLHDPTLSVQACTPRKIQIVGLLAAEASGAASLESTDYSQVDVLGSRYESVNFSAPNSRAHQICETKQTEPELWDLTRCPAAQPRDTICTTKGLYQFFQGCGRSDKRNAFWIVTELEGYHARTPHARI